MSAGSAADGDEGDIRSVWCEGVAGLGVLDAVVSGVDPLDAGVPAVALDAGGGDVGVLGACVSGVDALDAEASVVGGSCSAIQLKRPGHAKVSPDFFVSKSATTEQSRGVLSGCVKKKEERDLTSFVSISTGEGYKTCQMVAYSLL